MAANTRFSSIFCYIPQLPDYQMVSHKPSRHASSPQFCACKTCLTTLPNMPNLTTKHARWGLKKAAFATRLGIFCKITVYKRCSGLTKTTKSPSGLHKKPDPFLAKKRNKPHVHTFTRTSHDPYPIKPQLLLPPPMRGGERSAIRIMPPEKA